MCVCVFDDKHSLIYIDVDKWIISSGIDSDDRDNDIF